MKNDNYGNPITATYNRFERVKDALTGDCYINEINPYGKREIIAKFQGDSADTFCLIFWSALQNTLIGQ